MLRASAIRRARKLNRYPNHRLWRRQLVASHRLTHTRLKFRGRRNHSRVAHAGRSMAWRERGGVDAAHHSRLPCDDLNQLDLGIWIAAAVACPRGGPKQAALTNDTATATNVKCAPQPSHVEGLVVAVRCPLEGRLQQRQRQIFTVIGYACTRMAEGRTVCEAARRQRRLLA